MSGRFSAKYCPGPMIDTEDRGPCRWRDTTWEPPLTARPTASKVTVADAETSVSNTPGDVVRADPAE